MSKLIKGFSATLLAAALAASIPALAQVPAGSADEGKEVFNKCRSCHQVGPDAKNTVGPVLNDLIGRKAGTVDGYSYSDANKTKGAGGLVWDEKTLFEYLEKPLQYIPGTKMAFAGLKDGQDRADVIAYLKTFSKK